MDSTEHSDPLEDFVTLLIVGTIEQLSKHSASVTVGQVMERVAPGDTNLGTILDWMIDKLRAGRLAIDPPPPQAAEVPAKRIEISLDSTVEVIYEPNLDSTI